jgi:large subunit ribosomal protein L15
MSLNNLKPAQGSIKTRKRIGRGQGSGNGETAGKGVKGQKSRTGYNAKSGFEGGQMPLQRRVPKFGFKNINRVEYNAINLDALQKLVDEQRATDTVNLEVLMANGLASKNDLIKVLGRGEIKAALTVVAHKFSKTAQAAIEAAGGRIETL